ncbi:MAG: thiamine pyrophosphate-dependent enzyme [Vicinamibacterales bacterium]
MPRAAASPPSRLSGLASRLSAFVTERHPLVVDLALEVFDAVGGGKLKPRDSAGLETLRTAFRRELARRRYDRLKAPEGTDHTTPGTTAVKRMEQARAEIVDACDGFLRRESIAASLTRDERIEILRGMVLTRAVDNRLKQFFAGGEVRWGDTPFQGKGFRSLGQEAIYAAGIRLRRGPAHRGEDGTWRGDVVAPVIRDIGIALAMRHDAEAVRGVLTAQMGKDGPPMYGRDLHTGDFGWGVLPATAPLAIGSLSIAGMATAFWREGSERVAVCFIGEGGSSLGEWHEAINACAARRLPAVFCVENNQTALSTPVPDTSAVRVFADKAVGYGIPGISVDGTDPEAVAAAFTWAAERARAGSARRSSRRLRCACAGMPTTTTCCTSARIRRPRGTTTPCTRAGTRTASSTTSGRSATRCRGTPRSWSRTPSSTTPSSTASRPGPTTSSRVRGARSSTWPGRPATMPGWASAPARRRACAWSCSSRLAGSRPR